MSQKILPRGDPKSPVWVVCEKPYEKDAQKGYVWSCPVGFVFDRCWRDAGIRTLPFLCNISDIDSANELTIDFKVFLAAIDHFKPPIICTMGKKVTALFCPETRSKRKGVETDESSLEKWAGSLLESPSLHYSHYCIPQLTPDRICSVWEYRFIYTGIDLGHVGDELAFLDKNNTLQPLPRRELLIHPTHNDIIGYLDECGKSELISVDIETIRPVKSSAQGKHPGYPYTIALADSPERGMSFCFWDYPGEESIGIFKALDGLLSKRGSIGQNWFTFDTHFLEALGFTICLGKCEDTMLRHQLLWPELPHKLQFLTKQYTRQPYYKDEGKGWSPKNKKALMHYNTLDATVTYEVYLGQDEEFKDRPYLK